MKVTVEAEKAEGGRVASVHDPSVVTAAGALNLVVGALVSYSFHPESVEDAIIARANAIVESRPR